MGLLPETRNVIQLGICFFLVFFAFQSQGSIEESVIASQGSIDKHAGYNSLAIIYFVFTFANFIAAPIVDTISPKWAMVLGGICYALFQAGFLFLNVYYLYASSALLGFGAAIIWTGQGSYLAKNCTEQTSSRNSSMLWSMLQCSCIGGGTFILVTFSVTGSTDNITHNTVIILYSVFTVLTVLGVVILALLPAPPAHLSITTQVERQHYTELIASTFQLMATKKMLFLAVVFAYSGIEQSFWTGIYPTCISFTKKLGNNTNQLMAINTILAGFGQCIAGALFGIFSAKTAKLGKDMIVFLGAVIHLIVFGLVFVNFPADANITTTQDTGYIGPYVWIALLCGFLLGFGDACWNTQIYAFLVAHFPGQSSQAFALYKFYQSGLSCAAFFYSPAINLPFNLLILAVTVVLAAVCFFAVERVARAEERRHQFEVQQPPYNSSAALSSEEYEQTVSED